MCLGPGKAPAQALPAPSAEVKDPGEGFCSAAKRGVPTAGTTRGLVSRGNERLSRGVTWAAGGAGGNVPRGAEAGAERRPWQHWPPGPLLPPQRPHPRCRLVRQCLTGPWAPSTFRTDLRRPSPAGTGHYSQAAQKQRLDKRSLPSLAPLKNLPRFSRYELNPRLLSREHKPLQPIQVPATTSHCGVRWPHLHPTPLHHPGVCPLRESPAVPNTGVSLPPRLKAPGAARSPKIHGTVHAFMCSQTGPTIADWDVTDPCTWRAQHSA